MVLNRFYSALAAHPLQKQFIDRDVTFMIFKRTFWCIYFIEKPVAVLGLSLDQLLKYSRFV